MLRCNAASVRMKPSKLGQFLHSYVTSRLILFLEGAALFTDPKLVKTLVWYGTVTGEKAMKGNP